jgi:hypothetical protein
MTKTYYTVLIAAGLPAEYSRKQGWDRVYASRADADACAERARSNDGWSAKVIELSASEAEHWHETPDERLVREKREFDASLRAHTLYR